MATEADGILELRIGGPFPWHGTYRGVPVVAISGAEYLRLTGVPAPARRGPEPRMVVSRWDADPEMAAFVLARLGAMPQKTIHAEAVERFGLSRVPSLSALSRFAVKCRLERGGRVREARVSG